MKEMTMERCDFCPDAKAVVLDRRGEITFTYYPSAGLMYHFAEGVRVKILDASAAGRANVKIRYYSPSASTIENNERVMELKGVTYNLENGKIVTTRLERADIYRTRLNAYTEEVSFALPAVKAGSVIEYSYTRESNYISSLPDWFFQEDIPTLSNELLYILPEYFNFQARMMGEIQPLKREEKRVTTQLNDVTHPGLSVWMRVQEVPPVEEEPYVSNPCDLPFRVEFQLVSVDIPGIPVMHFAGSYRQFNKQLVEDSYFWRPATRGSFPVELKEQVAGMGVEAKIAFLTRWLQERVTWDEKSGITASRGAREILRDGHGSVAEINLALNSLFRQHGLEAYPVVLSTRGHGVIHPIYPNFDDFNYVISAVKTGENAFFLCDATSHTPPGLLPPHCLNGPAWLVSEGGGRFISLETTGGLKQYVSSTVRFENGKRVVNVEVVEQEYAALETRGRVARLGKEGFVEHLKERYAGWTLSNFEFERTPEGLRYLFTLEQEAGAGELLYVTPFPVLPGDAPFKRDTRSALVDFPYGTMMSHTTTIRVPEGYEVEIPEFSEFKFPKRGAACSFVGYMSVEGYVLTLQVMIRQLRYTPDEYPALKAFFDGLSEFSRMVVVLKKR
ncbi:MAG: DUF3857 domain-containing protein [Odoribacteraceae bacterium]|jgi:hypothetical protein|nr:DUF3857 domain-containing protein [Odoribacteraceae bacterium]